MPGRRNQKNANSRQLTAAIETFGLGMVVVSLLITLSFVVLQACDYFMRH